MTQPPWTYSHLDSFETCPQKFYRTKVLRDIVEPQGEAAKWGERVHTAFELRVKEGTPMPSTMEQWEKLASRLAALPGEKLAEQRFALDRNFQPTAWKTAWTRGIADLTVIHGKTAATLDYKTGKRKPSEQLELYSAYIFAHYPDVEVVKAGFVWLRDKKIDWRRRTREEVPVIWQEFLPRVAKLESAYERNSWPARPSGLCRGWCPVTDCSFHKGTRT